MDQGGELRSAGTGERATVPRVSIALLSLVSNIAESSIEYIIWNVLGVIIYDE